MLDPISILLPLKRQDPAFLTAAVESVLRQQDGRWKLLVLLDPETPEPLFELLGSFADSRIELVEVGAPGFARALNCGLQTASTEFTAILLSDDRLHPSTIGTLQRHREKHPQADFFHSARRLMDAEGNFVGPVMPAERRVSVEAFSARASPVKHLLCWRVKKSLEIGGMDEDLSEHGCDDRDFPWRMAEAGCTFVPIRECLYEYRVHRGDRLTTSVPIGKQLFILQTMFRKHGVGESDTATYLQGAVDRYLRPAQDGAHGVAEHRAIPRRLYSEAPPELREQFLQAGFRKKHFFPHAAFRVNKGAPDGYLLAERVKGRTDPDKMRQLILYAREEATVGLPQELFFDRDVQWHEQHCGEPWQVAWASLAVEDDNLIVMTAVSDLVQRIRRRQEFRSRIDTRFGGWMHMLWNSVLDYAVDLGVRQVRIPTSALILDRMIDPTRNSKASMYERIYDSSVQERFETTSEGRWHVVDVACNASRIVRLAKQVRPLDPQKTVCIIHDTERGLGHADVDPQLAESMDAPSRQALERMLEIEAAAGVRTTYNIVGSFLKEVEERIRADGHTVGFHSYDHKLVRRLRRLPWHLRRILLGSRGAGSQWGQVLACRRVDSRIKGYRPPQSRLEDLTCRTLSYRNFEWLLSSTASLGQTMPSVEHGIVRLPVHLDDFSLYKGAKDYATWEREALDLVAGDDFISIGLHDCYAQHWLPHYEEFLKKLKSVAVLKTCDEAAGSVILNSARWV